MPKGVYLHKPCSEKTKMKMSKSRRGEGNSMFGRHHSRETKLKMRMAKLGKKLSDEHKRKMLEKKKGERSHFWQGGKSFEPYGTEFNNKLKAQIRARDNNQCQVCKTYENGRTHPVHHKDYCKKNNDPTNLITLCDPCHSRTNGNREYWQTLFAVS
jgi:hypothetical protein